MPVVGLQRPIRMFVSLRRRVRLGPILRADLIGEAQGGVSLQLLSSQNVPERIEIRMT